MAHVFQRLMLATECGEFDAGAQRLALALAARCGLPLAAVLPLASNPEFEAVAPQQAAHAEEEAAQRSQQLRTAAAQAGVALALRVRRGPELAAEIVAEARERGCDLLILRRRGRRGLLANLLVGEMVSRVAADAPCSLLFGARQAQLWQRRVLVGIDPEVNDAGLPQRAAAVAQQCGLPLTVLAVARQSKGLPAAERAAAAAAAVAQALGVPVQARACAGRPHEQLVEQAQACGADLLVIGRQGGPSGGRAALGSTAQQVIGLADCPVLVNVP